TGHDDVVDLDPNRPAKAPQQEPESHAVVRKKSQRPPGRLGPVILDGLLDLIDEAIALVAQKDPAAPAADPGIHPHDVARFDGPPDGVAVVRMAERPREEVSEAGRHREQWPAVADRRHGARAHGSVSSDRDQVRETRTARGAPARQAAKVVEWIEPRRP